MNAKHRRGLYFPSTSEPKLKWCDCRAITMTRQRIRKKRLRKKKRIRLNAQSGHFSLLISQYVCKMFFFSLVSFFDLIGGEEPKMESDLLSEFLRLLK